MCVLDAQLSDNFNWSPSAVTTFIHRCQTLIEHNTDLWVNTTQNDTEVIQLPQDLLDILMCENNCSGHGQCSGGK